MFFSGRPESGVKVVVAKTKSKKTEKKENEKFVIVTGYNVLPDSLPHGRGLGRGRPTFDPGWALM